MTTRVISSMCRSLYSNLYCRTERSGEVTLRTTQFLEQLRKNPTLKMMRDELVSLLQEQLEKIGIPPVSSDSAFRL